MSRSADASLLRDSTPCRDLYRCHLHEVSVMSEPSKATAAGGATSSMAVEDTVLLEIHIPVFVKLEDREEERRQLGVFVHTGRGGANGLSRKVSVRLTDPTDPFFLFELELLEDDYGLFKQRLELLVDFSGFPKYLVSMLNGLVSGLTPYVVSFVVESRDTTRGLLRVLERTEFRTVDHISLLLVRQGDAGQKRYLAERFQYFERAYARVAEEHRAGAAAATANIEALKTEVQTLQENCRALREQLGREVAKSEKDQLESVGRLREEHSSEMSRLRASFDADFRRTAQKAEEMQRQLMDDVRTKDKELHDANEKITSMESTIAALQSQLRIAEDRCSVQTKELDELRNMNSELYDFRSRATRSLSDNELNCVKLQERVRGLVQTLKSRDEELQSLREQYHKQDNYISILTSQNEQLTAQSKKSEVSLAKTHHIITTQLRHIKGLKERENMMRNQIRGQDALLQEKVSAIARLRDELASSTERVQLLQNKATELRDQLAKTDTAREKLAQELKQSQDALIHLQRSTSVNGRHWSVLGCTTLSNSSNNNLPMNNGPSAGLSSSAGSTFFDVHKEFNRNGNTTFRNSGWVSSHGTNDVYGMPTAKPQTGVDDCVGATDGADAAQCGGAKKKPQGSFHPPSDAAANGVETEGAAHRGGGNTARPPTATRSHTTNGNYVRQPLDTTTTNVALNQTKQAFAAKSFFGDGVNNATFRGNAAVFEKQISPTRAAAVAAAPSAYF